MYSNSNVIVLLKVSFSNLKQPRFVNANHLNLTHYQHQCNSMRFDTFNIQFSNSGCCRAPVAFDDEERVVLQKRTIVMTDQIQSKSTTIAVTGKKIQLFPGRPWSEDVTAEIKTLVNRISCRLFLLFFYTRHTTVRVLVVKTVLY